MRPAIFRPSPVSVTMPTMMPGRGRRGGHRQDAPAARSSACSSRRGHERVRAIDEAQGDGDEHRVEHGAERRHPHQQHDRDADEREEVVARPARELPQRLAAGCRPACVPARRVSASIIRKIEKK